MEITPWSNATKGYSLDLRPKLALSASLSGAAAVSINLAPAVLNAERKVKEQDTIYQKATSYSLTTVESLVSADDIPVKGFNSHLPEAPNPLILEGRNTALSKINSLLAKVNKIKETLLSPEDEIVCPYEQTKAIYLGRNYVAPSIQSLTYPETFSIEKALPATAAINAVYYNIMLTQLRGMSAEAVDTNFAGITSENIGNAFASLSSTSEGDKYVINKKKLADHIEFAEIVKSIPLQEIVDNPREIAFKLIHRFIEINSDIDMSKDLPYFIQSMEIPSMEPIPQPILDSPMQAPRTNSLPIEHPALQYISQPSYWPGEQPAKDNVLSK